MEKNNYNRTVTEKINAILTEFEISELKDEQPKDNSKKEEFDKALETIKNCVGKICIINENGGDKQEDAFKESAKVVFDSKSKNFHVFPNTDKYDSCINECFKDKRELILAKETIEQAVGSIRKFEICETLKSFNEIVKTEKDKLYFVKGFGKKGGSGRLSLYKYVTVFYNDAWYTLNFVRMWCDEKKVNCDFKSLQYHRDCSKYGYGLNTNKKGEFDICYPFTSKEYDCHVNSAGNICFNPPVSFYPNCNETKDEHAITILNNFINFIKECDNLISKKNIEIENELRRVLK